MAHFQAYARTFDGNQSDLAAVLKISQPRLSQVLSGKKRSSPALAVRIESLTDGTVPVKSPVKADSSPAPDTTP